MHKLIVANYKMNGDLKFYKFIAKKLNSIKLRDTKIVLCPPFVYLSTFKTKNKTVSLGCQDIAGNINGKSTGQISPAMLKQFNVKYAIVGHSERRAIGETDEMIATKVKSAIENGIVPIVCVGEFKKNSALNTIINQVEFAIKGCSKENKIVFAYEPVWAIGSGEIPSNARINKVVSLIKKTVEGCGIESVCLYGGSVNAENFLELNKCNIDGFLLGGVSREFDNFMKIVKGVDNDK